MSIPVLLWAVALHPPRPTSTWTTNHVGQAATKMSLQPCQVVFVGFVHPKHLLLLPMTIIIAHLGQRVPSVAPLSTDLVLKKKEPTGLIRHATLPVTMCYPDHMPWCTQHVGMAVILLNLVLKLNLIRSALPVILTFYTIMVQKPARSACVV